MNFFDFDSFITPTLIKIVFFLGIGAITLGYVGSVAVTVITEGPASAVVPFFVGGIGFVIGILMWRVYCEITIVVFQMFDELKPIRRAVSDHEQQPVDSDPHTL